MYWYQLINPLPFDPSSSSLHAFRVLRGESSLPLDRQCECKFAAFRYLALDPNLPAMHLDELSGQGQTESCAFALLCIISACLPEFFENRFLILLGDTDAGVRDRNDHCAVTQTCVHLDLSAFGRELHGVRK